MQEAELFYPKKGSRRLTTILVADICGYSALSEKNEQSAIQLSDRAFNYFVTAVEGHGGRLFSRIADGFLADFSSAKGGMEAGLAFLETLKKYNEVCEQGKKISVRLGIHVGDVTDRADGDIFGHGVNIAVRLQEKAFVNTILASKNVINLVNSHHNFHVQKRGPLTLKNIEQPLVAYTVTASPQSLMSGIKRYAPNLKFVKISLVGLAVTVGTLSYINLRTEKPPVNADEVIQAYFSSDSLQTDKSGYSENYLRYVLENLQGSSVDSERATFELLRAGNISGAIENLEFYRRARLTGVHEQISFDSDEHVNLLNQLAALSYHQDPSKSEAYYKAILLARPTDTRAKLWLARTQNQKGESAEAAESMFSIDESQILNADDVFQLNMDRAFNFLLKHEFEKGLMSLQALEEESKSVQNERLILEWKTNLAIALERLGRFDEAEKLVTEVVSELNKIGADTNMPRAYSVWGQIYEQRAFAVIPPEQGMLRTALEKYEQQYRFGEKLNKDAELAESLHYMGAIHLALNELAQGRQKYSMGLLMAENMGMQRTSVRSRIGLAYLHLQEGNKPEACNMQTSIDSDIEMEGIPLRPRNASLLNEIRSACAKTTE